MPLDSALPADAQPKQPADSHRFCSYRTGAHSPPLSWRGVPSRPSPPSLSSWRTGPPPPARWPGAAALLAKPKVKKPAEKDLSLLRVRFLSQLFLKDIFEVKIPNFWHQWYSWGQLQPLGLKLNSSVQPLESSVTPKKWGEAGKLVRTSSSWHK